MAEDASWIRTRSRFYRLGARYEHKPLAERVDEVLGPGPRVPAQGRPTWPVRDYFPDLGPDGGLPPLEDDVDALPKP
jgi:hypothetical protein